MTLKKPYIYALLALIIIIGGFFRFFDLSHQSYWMDEGYTINAVLSINETGSTVLDSGLNYFCPTYCYPTAYVTQLFGENAFSYRFLAGVFGTLFIIAIFFITRKIFTTPIALVSSFFISFSYWQIAWSRQARWYTLFALFFWLSAYFFYQTLYAEKNRKMYFVLTTLFTTLSILTHGLGYLLPFIFLGWFLVDQIFIKKSISLKKVLSATLALLTFCVTLAFVFKVELFTALLTKIHFSYELPYYLSFYLRTYWLFIILSFVALSITDSKYKKETSYFAFISLAYLIPLSFLTDIVHYRYLFHVTPVLFILSAFAIVAIIKNIPKLYQKISFVTLVIILFFTIVGGVAYPRNTYYLESDDPSTLGERPHYAYTPQPDWNSAYAYIQAHRTESDIVISSHPHFNKIFLNEPGYWIQYDYLGLTSKPNTVTNGKEYYVGAEIVSGLPALEQITKNKHGFVIFDYMATDGKIPSDTLQYISQNMQQVFYKKTNIFSQVWVYQF